MEANECTDGRGGRKRIPIVFANDFDHHVPCKCEWWAMLELFCCIVAFLASHELLAVTSFSVSLGVVSSGQFRLMIHHTCVVEVLK